MLSNFIEVKMNNTEVTNKIFSHHIATYFVKIRFNIYVLALVYIFGHYSISLPDNTLVYSRVYFIIDIDEENSCYRLV